MNTVAKRIDWSVKPSSEARNANNTLSANSALKAEELKSALVKKLSAQYAEVGNRLVSQAVNEAHALASLTFVPLLLLPTLAEEKVQQVAAWHAHQRSLLGDGHIAFAA